MGSGVGRRVGAVVGAAVGAALAAGLRDGAALGRGDGEGEGVCAGDALGSARRGDGDGDGVCAGTGVGLGDGDGVACGTAVREVSGVAVATGVTTGSGVTIAVVLLDDVVVVDRLCQAERNAPIPRPTTTTPTPSTIVGSRLPPPSSRRGGGADPERRRRGGSADIARRFRAADGTPPVRPGMEAATMLRIAIPIDVSAVADSCSAAFALATPLRVGDLLAAAVVDALGRRAPQDKRDRMIRSTLDGLTGGRYVLEIDGRIYTHPDDVAVCSGTATLRFFLRHALRAA